MTLRLLVPVALAALLLVGAGCQKAADQAASDAVSPVTAPLAALEATVDATGALKISQQDAFAQATDPVTVAFVIIDGHIAQAGILPGEVFGCSDQVGFLAVPRVQDSGNEVADAVATLLAEKESNVYELYNALAFSSLKLDKVDEKDGVTGVWLKGQPLSGGTCDDPRIKTQVEATVARLKPSYKIYLNGSESEWRCIGNMSGECK
jgi:hypothetical protein